MLDPKEVDKFLKSIPRSQIFSVKFVKMDGTTRTMVCRRDVKRYLKGGVSTIKNHKNLVQVFDMQKKEYRCFDKNYVMEIK